MRTRLCLFALGALLTQGCKKDAPKAGPGSGSAVVGSGSAAGSTAPAADGSVEIFVDEKSVAKVTKEQLEKWPRLDSLVPEDSRRLGTWVEVSLVTAKPTPAKLQKPSANYPDMVPVIYPGEGGTVSFGMFDPVELAKRGKPGMREDNVREVRIEVSKEGRGGDHQGGGGESGDPANLKLVFELADGKKELTGAQILALPRENAPGMADQKGWKLTALLDAAGVKTYKKLILIDAGGISLPFEQKELADPNAVAFVKLNKQGTLRFRMYKKDGDAWKASADLRALATIKVQ